MQNYQLKLMAIAIISLIALFDLTWGHGMMLKPPGRSSRWRYNSSAPVNYNDNENFCGGFAVSLNKKSKN